MGESVENLTQLADNFDLGDIEDSIIQDVSILNMLDGVIKRYMLREIVETEGDGISNQLQNVTATPNQIVNYATSYQ